MLDGGLLYRDLKTRRSFNDNRRSLGLYYKSEFLIDPEAVIGVLDPSIDLDGSGESLARFSTSHPKASKSGFMNSSLISCSL